mmetsp:Transcript_1718/g.3670  ORF Transcript_1718/g.3670 Transcript_1718/m.3670 type:complete len:189 (-) Transcript_1718:258-824(-)|eukprot:CAMPEP_0172313882 /NCGR_PEP_ID=MMETSP1058-20130122/21188_1 /TAXON_ID=83371 /ORGANISM="Detonula confervacea, Strain CCMP 353" /LENGTH=188 /DNA_ID=CAMNT_0013027607 /DNA_START=64 /DNA_END=630 /DNA_ORIENTATION=+
MSTDASPEETPIDASPNNPDDGGSSLQLTQGEIIFATLLSFVVLVAVILGIYVIYMHRRNQLMDQKDAGQRRPSHGQGTVTSCVVDGDTGAIDHQVDNAENGNSDRNSSHGPGSRRAIIDSNGSGMKNIRQGNHRRATVDGSGSNGMTLGGESSRRASISSGAPTVPSHYKLAAIEHMNLISQTGRHD